MAYGLRGFLFAVVSLSLVTALGLMGLALNMWLKDRLLAEKEAELLKAALALSRLAAENCPPGASRAEIDAWATRMGQLGNYRVSLINQDGQLYGDSLVAERDLDSQENHANRPEVIAAFHQGWGRGLRFSSTLAEPYVYAAARIDYENAPPKVLRVAATLESLRQARLELMSVYVPVVALGLALALFLVWLLTRRLSLNFSQIVQSADRMAGGDLKCGILRPPKGELGRIAQALNRLAENLSAQMARTEKNLAHLEAVLEAMDEGVVAIDGNKRVSRVNRRAVELLGLNRAEGSLVGECLRQPHLSEDLAALAAGSKPQARMLHRPGPPELFLELKLSPVPYDGGAVAVFHDLTERQKLYRLRRDFVAHVSHELRTPLTAIMGAVETLAEAVGESPAQRSCLKIIERHSARLRELAGDLIELARLEESESAPFQKELMAASELFDEAAAAVGALTRERLRIELWPADFIIAGRRADLKSALANMLENAVKYGDAEAEIILRGQKAGPTLRLSVINQGTSVPEEERDRIFERFYRGARSRGEGPAGTGLGLAIVKHTALAHGGRCYLKTPQEGGAAFTLELPAEGGSD